MNLKDFVQYCNTHITGDEKGEAQIFLDHFFQALGHADGIKGAGATLEDRIKSKDKRSTSFADLVWKPRVLIEMKRRGTDLSLHYQQVFTYWTQLVPNRPRYVMLCNFDQFWIYDFDQSLDPQEIIQLADLPRRSEAFSFLLPKEAKPLFRNNRQQITEKVAQNISELYKKLTNKNRSPQVEKDDAMRYCLQCILALFAEDIGLLPDKIFSRLINECHDMPGSGYDKIEQSFDLIGGLFEHMNKPGKTPAGKYKDVDYFNGGLFTTIEPIELTKKEVEDLWVAADKDWKDINPAIFGSIFENLMEGAQRHELGAHYTHESDIKKIVDPVIVQPWQRRLEALYLSYDSKEHDTSFNQFLQLHKELTTFKVLDPACGSGNFLFIAYKELKLLEKELLKHIKTLFNKRGDTEKFFKHRLKYGVVTTKQFYGLDLNPIAVELAKVTLMIAKEVTAQDPFFDENALPLDNLDNNIIHADALFTTWPDADVIIGNPPFQSKNKMQEEFGVEYNSKVRATYPEVPGRADFCVYWFYKAHKHLKEGSYAGLVGTNTIRQNYSREGSLDYIVHNGGEIFSAVSSMRWSGEAAVHVSIACWKKGKFAAQKELYTTTDKELIRTEVPIINSSLSLNVDVTQAKVLECNRKPKKVFQGQTQGHEGFLLSKAEGLKLLQQHAEYKAVLKPFLIGEELVGNFNAQPARFVIDFTMKDLMEASSYKELYKIISTKVLPARQAAAKQQEELNDPSLKDNPKAKVNKHHINFLNKWWKLSYGREDMLEQKNNLKRYIACARVTQRPIFDFFEQTINPNDKLMAFMFEDYYSFGVIQSNVHWQWFLANCTTLGETPNYNTGSIWDTFPFPQHPTEKQVKKVADAARALHTERTRVMQQYRYSLRDLYRILEQPGKNPIKDLHVALDKAVAEAYGFDPAETSNVDFILQSLLELNLKVSAKEKSGEAVTAPGLPAYILNKAECVGEECVRFEWG